MDRGEHHLPDIRFTRDLGWPCIAAGRRAGEVERIRPGAFGPAPDGATTWDRERQQALAMAAAVAGTMRTDVVFSHTTAALLHGLPVGSWDGYAHVLVSTRQGRMTGEGVRRHLDSCGPEEIVEIAGLPTTNLWRTIVDCTRNTHPRIALAIADAGLRMLAAMNRFDREESERREAEVRARLLQLLARWTGAKGTLQASAILHAATGFSESFGESVLRWIVLAFGLPKPICQLEIVTPAGSYFPDLAWRLSQLSGDPSDLRVLAEEYDGIGKYAHRADHDGSVLLNRESRRDRALVQQGVDVRHRGAPDLRNPDALARSIAGRFPAGLLGRMRKVRGLYVPA
ncbi:MAG: hypothetical protein LCH77_13585 [Actinobacteria bacterium]|nr:hypothetical protein [Actinomycetota bacterium]